MGVLIRELKNAQMDLYWVGGGGGWGGGREICNNTQNVIAVLWSRLKRNSTSKIPLVCWYQRCVATALMRGCQYPPPGGLHQHWATWICQDTSKVAAPALLAHSAHEAQPVKKKIHIYSSIFIPFLSFVRVYPKLSFSFTSITVRVKIKKIDTLFTLKLTSQCGATVNE